MSVFIGLLKNVLEEGFIYAILALGVYVSYTILDFPDLSVDGTFPLGACATAALIAAGVNPLLACLISFVCGALAGCLTGVLHVVLKIRALLCGILVMTALWSVNLVITGNKSVLPFYDMPTIFNGALASLLPENLYRYRVVIIGLLCALLVKLLLDLFFATKAGLLLRAVGDNAQLVTSLAKDEGSVKILGLAIANGCAALSGSVLAQQAESANISSGTGMVVLALASVIIGQTVFRRLKGLRATSAVLLGAVLYKACLSLAMQLGLPASFLKLLMAAILVAALMSDKLSLKRRASHAD
ncbi:MAG: ABC transporter permease [Oscillospiraceae bacterium]|nr:ABC transporter permease [Oscillospiraceae bacterium]